jgi:hypothetical protein
MIKQIAAEWPLVELCARAVVADGVFKFVRLGAGGIAPVPLRLKASEAALEGQRANAAAIAEAARQATVGAKPLPTTGYKLDLLGGLVRDLLEQLSARRNRFVIATGRDSFATPNQVVKFADFYAIGAVVAFRPTRVMLVRMH